MLKFNSLNRHIVFILTFILATFMFASQPCQADDNSQKNKKTLNIKGKVVDEDNIPLPGVSVMVPGTKVGTVTNVDGFYDLNVPKSAKELEFSFIGMKTETVSINKRSLINMIMKDEMEQIEQVIVTGYGNIAKEAYTGSASVMSSKKIGNRAVSNIENVIRGNVAGAIVSTTGQPGEMSEVRLRGVGSMNASNQPLYVVDGVIWDLDNVTGSSMTTSNPLNALNPSDIESTTILRDAASASLYGSRGANGVIVITTKKGEKSDKINVNVDLQGGISKMQRAPKLVGGRDFADLWVEGQTHANIYDTMLQKEGETFIPKDELAEQLTKMYEDKIGYLFEGRNFYEYQKQAQQQFNNLFQMPTGEGGYRRYDYFGDDYDKLPNTDWFKEISRTAPFYKASVSISGGNKSMTYYASLDYFDQEGIILNSKLQRSSIRIKLNSDNPKNFVNWGLNSYISNPIQTGPMSGSTSYSTPMYAALRLPSVLPAFLEDGSYNFNFPSNILNTNHNPVASAKENDNRKNQLSFTVSGNIKLNFTKNINLTSIASIYYYGLQRRTYYDSHFGSGYQYNGILTERDVHRNKLTSTTMLNFDKNFRNNHRLTFNGGVEFENLDYKFRQLGVNNFQGDVDKYLSNGSVVNAWSGGGYGHSQFSIITQASYSWMARYYLSASFRQDKSSRFAKGHRTGNFWSVSGAWRVSGENFWKPIKPIVNNLRLKTSYGINGNLPSIRYNRNLYSPVRNINDPGAVLTYVAYAPLSWEQNGIYNLGLEAGFLRDRIRFSAEFYHRKSKDLLIDLPVSSTSGFDSKLQNVSSAGIRNTGFEFELSGAVVETKDFYIDANLNLSTLRARYFGLPESYIDNRQRQLIANGYSPNTWWLREYAGISPETGQQLYWKTNEDGTREKVTSNSGLPYTALKKQGIPKLTGGFSTSIGYKNIELSALFSFATGFYLYDRQASYTEDDGRQLGAVSVNQLDRWTPLHRNATAPLRMLGYSSQSRTTRFLIKGDYLKLRNLSLTYSLPKKLIKPLGMRRVKVFLQTENLGVWTKMKDYDPELSIDGYRNYDTYPFAISITGGVSLKF